MKFFKENNDKGKEVPTFPTGDGDVETAKYGFETIHPCVCTLDFPSLLIHFLIIQPILFGITAIPRIRTYIRSDAVGNQGSSEFFPVKTCVKITEKSVYGDRCFGELADNLIDPFFYLVEIGVISCLRLRHCKGNALIVRKKEGIGRTSFLPALISSLFSASIYRRMGTVDMGKGQVKPVFIPAQNPGIDLLPFLFSTPFAVMVEDRLPARFLTAEKMSCREKTPLASALELVEYRVYNLLKIEFGGKTSFCGER